MKIHDTNFTYIFPFTFSAPLTLITLRKFVIDVYLLTLGGDKCPEGSNAHPLLIYKSSCSMHMNDSLDDKVALTR